jgi:DNA-binding response OmpR family regulator
LSPFLAAAPSAERYEDAHLIVNFQTGASKLDGKELKMPRKEFELLVCLLRQARELVNRETLLMTVWGYSPGVRTRTLDVHIRRLRQSLEPYGKIYIETVFGVGYRLQPCPRKRAEPTALPVRPLDAHVGSGAWRWNYSLQ